MMLRETLLAGLALASLASAGAAEAGIIYGPILNGYTTFTDTDTGLNWVRMDSFFNASYDDMASAVEAAGFTVAARSEVATLLDSLPIYDTSDWDFIQTFSPYHLFDAKKDYPPTLFTTSTKDDRVHPAHARKLMAKMEAAGKNVRYYENIEGGHGGAANNAQAAHMSALAYTFLWQQLTK